MFHNNNMNKMIKKYLNSFKVKKDFWQIFVIDSTFFLTFLILFQNIKSILINLMPKEMVGRTPEQLQSMVGSNPEKLVEIMLPIQKYLLTYFVTFTVFFIFAFILYSLSRSLIWEVIINKKKMFFSKHFKWNLLNLMLIVPLITYLIFVFIIKLVLEGSLKYLLTSSPYLQLNYPLLIRYTHSTFANLISFYLIVGFLYYMFFVYNKFVNGKKVFASIIGGLNLFHNNFKKINKFILFSFITLIPFIIIMVIAQKFFYMHINPLLYFNGILSFIYLSWIRTLFVREVLHK